jgi:uracil-DNA glycosylase family 4
MLLHCAHVLRVRGACFLTRKLMMDREMLKAAELNLQALSIEISQCRLCDKGGLLVEHAPPLQRGKGSDLLVIGEQPGKTELATAAAFSGLAGQRLISWLTSSGLGQSREEIFQRAYFTSLCKCHVIQRDQLNAAIYNCYPYLLRQVNLLNPRIVCTLGREPLVHLLHYEGPLEDAVGRTWRESDFGLLFPLFPRDCVIVPFPHPSPRSLWLNTSDNQKRLETAIEQLRRELKC